MSPAVRPTTRRMESVTNSDGITAANPTTRLTNPLSANSPMIDAMWSGQVDETWAREHHSLWEKELQGGTKPAAGDD